MSSFPFLQLFSTWKQKWIDYYVESTRPRIINIHYNPGCWCQNLRANVLNFSQHEWDDSIAMSRKNVWYRKKRISIRHQTPHNALSNHAFGYLRYNCHHLASMYWLATVCNSVSCSIKIQNSGSEGASRFRPQWLPKNCISKDCFVITTH